MNKLKPFIIWCVLQVVIWGIYCAVCTFMSKFVQIGAVSAVVPSILTLGSVVLVGVATSEGYFNS